MGAGASAAGEQIAKKATDENILDLSQDTAGDEPGMAHQSGLDKLESIPEAVFNMKNLTSITIKANNIKTIDGLEALVAVTSLDVSENQIATLPDLSAMVGLEELDISENSIVDLGAWIGSLSKLTKFIAFKNQFKKLPAEFGQLVVLEELNLFNNQLISLPDSMSECVGLVDVSLGSNKLKKLPKMAKWANCTRLAAQWNKIMMVPGGFAGMEKLSQLQMDNNMFGATTDGKLPTMGNKPELELFEFTKNSLSTLEDETGTLDWLATAVKVKTFNAGNNQIKGPLPEQIGTCAQIEILNVGGNTIDSIPESIGNCKELKTFFFNGCPVTKLPECMSTADALKPWSQISRLNCNGCPVATAPETAGIKAQCEANKGRFIA